MSAAWRLAELGRYLDPRPEVEAAARPYLDAVNIPTPELLGRLHELPPRSEPVQIVGSEVENARRLLEAGGRTVEVVPGEFATLGEPLRLWRPNAFLEEILPRLNPGRALDLGCGSGRESVALAGSGFEVVACDVLPDALEMGRGLAARYLLDGTPAEPPPIEWRRRDVEREGPPEGWFDLVVSFRFLHRPLLANIRRLLRPGGSLVLETFTTLHRERHGKPRSDAHVLLPGEAESLSPGLSILHADEGWRASGVHTARLWAKAE